MADSSGGSYGATRVALSRGDSEEKKRTILVVDGDEGALGLVEAALCKKYDVLTAATAAKAEEVLATQAVALVAVDERVKGAAELLARLNQGKFSQGDKPPALLVISREKLSPEDFLYVDPNVKAKLSAVEIAEMLSFSEQSAESPLLAEIRNMGIEFDVIHKPFSPRQIVSRVGRLLGEAPDMVIEPKKVDLEQLSPSPKKGNSQQTL